MAFAIHAELDVPSLDAQSAVDRPPAAHGSRVSPPDAALGDLNFSVHLDLATVEQDWREFEQSADCTVFQTFDWLATWQRHVGAPAGVQPAVVIGRGGAGEVLFILPLSLRGTGFVRELAWLGSDLCDYNAPLLAARFSAEVGRARFIALWAAILRRLQSEPCTRFDVVNMTKMPDRVGAQENPLRYLGGTVTPSGAYLTHLTGDWETFYAAKRSSATRRRDRTKRKRLGEFGEVRFVTAQADADVRGTLEILMRQKARAFARMGVSNLFARPGYAQFYRALAGDPATRRLVHVSRLDVGAMPAAVNLGLTFRDRYYHLLASYDEGDLSRFGPGAAHLHDLLCYAIGRNCRIFDFTIGDERYKRDWSDTELTLYDFICAGTWRGTLVVKPMLVALALKRWIKSTPALWQAFSAGRALLGSLPRKLRT